MNKRDIIIFISGACIGAVSSIFSVKNYFKHKYESFAEDRIREVEDYYAKKMLNEEDLTTKYRKTENKDEDTTADHEIAPREGGVLTQEERDAIKEKLLDNQARTSEMATNYHEISMRRFKENDNDEADEDDEEPITMTPEEIADEEHLENIDRKPRIISAEEYMNLPPSIDTQTLYFYHYDMVICDDDENEITDYERLIGDALTKYDFANSDEPIIFVMNYQIDTAFEIERVLASYSDYADE